MSVGASPGTGFTSGTAGELIHFPIADFDRPKLNSRGGIPAFVPSEDGQWKMPAKDYASTRYSGLDMLNTKNARNLKVAWTFSTGVNRGQEAAPLVVGSTMYVVTPFPNIVYALDVANDGAIKWKFESNPVAASQGVACCDVVNRGLCYDNGRLYMNTLDGQTICLDASTGKEIWENQLGDINKGETITMAPLVVKDEVLVGNSGGEFGVRGWLKAVNKNSGKLDWTAYSSGPDKDCLIGSNFKPFYAADRGKDLGVSTWPPGRWEIGGGTVWGWISYDPDLNLIYYGTANPGVWNPELRPGDNKWSCGIFARTPEDGDAKWYYQWSPHDMFDHDGINEQILLDLPVNGGADHKILVRAERNGFFYVLDRTTGEVLSATPFARITSALGVDLKTGRMIPVAEKMPQTGKVIRDVAPIASGAKDWQPCAYSPQTGYVYIPHMDMAMDYEGMEANYIAGTPYVGANVKMYPGPDGNRGEFCAWDPLLKQKVWAIKESFPVWSGTMATAGGLVCYGTMEGWFKVLDARTGELLWKFKTGSGIIGQPTTYKGPDGKQYIAILSGVGGWAGAIVSGDLDPHDGTAALGMVNAMKDLPEHTTKGGTLYVFGLP
jgi:PQQ-dependent dehydrogenase (methanol/ethanol family)